MGERGKTSGLGDVDDDDGDDDGDDDDSGGGWWLGMMAMRVMVMRGGGL